MTFLDIIIIMFILSGVIVGLKQGLFKTTVEFVGSIIIIILAFILKNPISIFLYKNLPFFEFNGITVLNIVVYEILAFLIIFSILTIALKIIILATNIFEKFLNFTIILGIPSKLGGAVVGFIQGYIYTFIALYIASMPVFNISQESKLKDIILKNTPILSKFVDNTITVMNEFKDLKDKYKNVENKNALNLETLDLFLKYDIISIEAADNLNQNGKIKIENIDSILNKYRKE